MIEKDKYNLKQLDFSEVKTHSAKQRKNLVTICNIADPEDNVFPKWGDSDFSELIKRILFARENNKLVIWSMGAHVIKSGMSRYVIELIKRGFITHIAGNGAVSIHDFELAYLGGTSEDVSASIEDGSFGMCEETGRWMNEALQVGALNKLGYGESLAVYVDNNTELFPYKEHCIFYQAYKNNVPATYHIALGTDIIHQHPIVDFGAIGVTSGIDFHKICYSVSLLEGGVFLNFGSSVIGPEVFLKALSISRNLGFKTYEITTGNFDLINISNHIDKFNSEDPFYYYRPLKNIVIRPTNTGGKGWHFCGDHRLTIPNLFKMLTKS